MILEYEGKDSLAVYAWVNMIVGARKSTLLQAEQDGFFRLVLGYKTPGSRDAMVSIPVLQWHVLRLL